MLGKSLAVALSRKDYPVVAAASRTFASAQALAKLVPGCTAHPDPNEAAAAADFVFISSSDDAIGPVAAAVTWRPGQGVAHCSGVASLDVLEPAERQGATAGAFHPLQVFSSVDTAIRSLPGATFAIEGSPEMRAYLQQMALDLEGRPIFLRSEDKPLYHASIVMMGGLLSGMVGAVADLWANFGIGRDEAVKSLVPIIQGNVLTLQSVGIPDAIAGPYARGDIGTVRKHLDAFDAKAPEALAVYCEMALAGLPYAVDKGNVTPERAAEIEDLLMKALGGPEGR